MNERVAIQNYVNGIKNVLKKTPDESVIIFETGAGQGTEVCTKIPELGYLYQRFTDGEKRRIKFCIDTCHVFAAGYDLSNDHYVKVFDLIINTHLLWKNVICIHLNDSKCPLDSRKDRHADLTTGHIKKDGLKKFVEICYERGVPMVLETPCDTELDRKKQIKMVKEWLNKN